MVRLVADVAAPHGIAPFDAIGNHFPCEMVRHGFHIGVVAIQNGRTICRERFDKLCFRLGDIRLASQDTDVRGTHIGDDADGGAGNAAKFGDLAKSAHAHFYHAHLGFLRHGKKRHGETDFIIKIFLGGAHAEARRQDRGGHIFRCGFPIGTGDADHRDVKTHPMEMGQVFQSLQGIRYQEYRYAAGGLLCRLFIGNNDAGRTGFACLFHKSMAIKIFAFQRDKYISILNRTSIGAHAIHVRFAAAGKELRPAGSHNFIYGKGSHKSHPFSALRASSLSSK